ncbi:citryl-CoA lyase [Arthrobacter sp. ISL-85]|uniref:citryl-CoA lyase n=1 Tax=Arthrobacter sp. ISL-85 TaxID=2819115 RepID=UPI001BE5D718|nr:citryl-CoA lyase [Arthrobacter sp. ISL-85]MBT2565212.1 citryl-CoA lyase [Arthrobacter sp. ISL-85]
MQKDTADQSGAYWSSSVSQVTDTNVYVRGYDLEDLIGQIPFTAAIFLVIRGRIPLDHEIRALDAVLSGILDYGLEKPGTVAARFAVSANPSMAIGMSAACLSVGKHTLATEDSGRFILATHAEFLGSGLALEAFAEEKVNRMREAKERIPGLGHPIFKVVDPRAERLRSIALQEGLWDQAAEVYEAVHRAFTKLPGKSDIPINDVGVMAAILLGLGFTPEEGTGVALLSTLPGVIAHVSEELSGGKPIRIVPRGSASYEGTTGRDFDADRLEAGWGPSGS